MSRFLKLSTSKDALLLPGGALSVVVRSSPLPLPDNSSEANVLENGLAGAVLGERTVCGFSEYDLELGSNTSGAAMSFLTPES